MPGLLRARQFLRSTVQRTDLPDETLAGAIRGLGRNYVTGQDATVPSWTTCLRTCHIVLQVPHV